MDAFFASCEVVKNPSLKGKPVIVGGSVENRGVVSAASYEARKYGVHSAMSMARAKKLCPHGIFITSNHADYVAFSERINEILLQFTPDVLPLSLDEAFLDITASQKLFGSAIEIAEKIKGLIKKETGLNASIGIASSKIAAKFASSVAKPDGIFMILPGYERVVLAPFPVGKICGIGDKTSRELERIGVETIGDLASIDEKTLNMTFGKLMGETLKKYANGMDPAPLKRESERKSISREMTFPEDLCDHSDITSKLNLLVEKAAFNLRKRGLKASTITLKIRFSDFSTRSHSRTLNTPTDRDDIIFNVSSQLLKNKLSRKKVRLIGVSLSNLTEASQIDIFDDRLGKKKEMLYKSIDSVREKFGFESILSAKTLLWKK